VICLVAPVVQSDIDAFVVNARGDANAGTGELCADLIEATCRDGLLRAVDVVGRDGGMMRGLFGEVRNLDLVTGSFGLDLIALEDRHIVFSLPLTLDRRQRQDVVCETTTRRTLKNSPREELYGLQGLPLTYFKSFVNQKRKQASRRPSSSSESPMLAKMSGLSR
jgi:hypothetical protein